MGSAKIPKGYTLICNRRACLLLYIYILAKDSGTAYDCCWISTWERRRFGQVTPIMGNRETYGRRRFLAFSLRQHSLNGLYHLRMHLLPRRDNTKIPTERAPKAKVERTPARIRDDAAGLFDEERPRRVVLARTMESLSKAKQSKKRGGRKRRLIPQSTHARTQIFSWYPPSPPPATTGNRKYTPPPSSPRTSAAYLACESMRTGAERTPRRAATRAFVSSAACAFSNDSRKESSESARRGMRSLVGGGDRDCDCGEEEEKWRRGSW
jgi:hypothetical protein